MADDKALDHTALHDPEREFCRVLAISNRLKYLKTIEQLKRRNLEDARDLRAMGIDVSFAYPDLPVPWYQRIWPFSRLSQQDMAMVVSCGLVIAVSLAIVVVAVRVLTP